MHDRQEAVRRSSHCNGYCSILCLALQVEVNHKIDDMLREELAKAAASGYVPPPASEG